MMRDGLFITGGAAKGRRIAVPGGEIRPAMALMRKVIFQVLANEYGAHGANEDDAGSDAFLRGRTAADLFSGSAIMALEFFSRGAAPVVAVESDRGKWRVIEENIASIVGPKEEAAKKHSAEQAADEEAHAVFLYKDKVERFVLRHRRAYDIVYCDPPFAYAHKKDLVEKIARSALLADGAFLVLHAPSREKFADTISCRGGALYKQSVRVLGGSSVWFWQKRAAAVSTQTTPASSASS